MRERHSHHPHLERTRARQKSPLKKIVEVLVVGDGDLFGSGDKVLLECGHSVYSKGIYKARCLKCGEAKQNGA